VDGWLRTGDVYQRSADGYYRFVGRNSDMIKAGGIWVSPAEVEGVLVEHEDVLEAAVVGGRNADGLEVTVAFVVLAHGRTADPVALDDHCRARMAAFKRPREIHVVSELPKTATGKMRYEPGWKRPPRRRLRAAMTNGRQRTFNRRLAGPRPRGADIRKESDPVSDAAPSRFESPTTVREGLRRVSYLADDGIAGVVYLAERLGKPVLVEGPAGTGKTQLAKSVAELTGARLIRLQCYEGLDESKALYEWNYKKQLLRIQAQRVGEAGRARRSGRTSRRTSSPRSSSSPARCSKPSGPTEPVVLLIDEVDRVEVETEALLLEILSDYQVSIPELGTVVATQIPLVFLTSNNTRELSEALKRRCLFLHIDYPDIEREREIVLTRVPGISASLADQVVRIVRSIRNLELKKAPSVSETLDWARTLLLLGIQSSTPRHGHRDPPRPAQVPVRHRQGRQGAELLQVSPPGSEEI
jgi:MoxR-like ATPase